MGSGYMPKEYDYIKANQQTSEYLKKQSNFDPKDFADPEETWRERYQKMSPERRQWEDRMMSRLGGEKALTRYLRKEHDFPPIPMCSDGESENSRLSIGYALIGGKGQ